MDLDFGCPPVELGLPIVRHPRLSRHNRQNRNGSEEGPGSGSRPARGRRSGRRDDEIAPTKRRACTRRRRRRPRASPATAAPRESLRRKAHRSDPPAARLAVVQQEGGRTGQFRVFLAEKGFRAVSPLAPIVGSQRLSAETGNPREALGGERQTSRRGPIRPQSAAGSRAGRNCRASPAPADIARAAAAKPDSLSRARRRWGRTPLRRRLVAARLADAAGLINPAARQCERLLQEIPPPAGFAGFIVNAASLDVATVL